MAKLGLFGLPFPEEYGGMGGDLFAFCLALEELARVDSSVAITLEAAVALGAMPIYRFGTEEQRRRWLPDLCAGERLAAFGLTEPGGGSDIPGGMRTTARLSRTAGMGHRRSEGVHHQRRHRHHLAGDRARHHRPRRPDGPGKEISAIIVPAGTPGFTVGREYSKVGWCASDTRELAFASCRVPGGHLLGERGRGYAQFLGILTRAGWRSRPWRPGWRRAAWRSACSRWGSARRSATGSASTRGSSSRWRTWRPGCTRPAGLVRGRGQAGARGAGEEAGGDRQADRLERGHGQRA